MDNSKTSPRQIAMLVILIGVLVVVVAVQYFIRPTLTETSELKAQTEVLEEKYLSMQEQSLMHMVDGAIYEEYRTELEEQGKQMLPYMKSNELDEIVTDMVLSSGLEIGSLRIGDIRDYKVRLLYEEKSDNTSEEESSNGDFEDSGFPDMNLYPGAELIMEDEMFYLQYKTGHYSCVLDYQLTGNYDQIRTLTDKIIADKSMGIENIYFTNSGDVSADGGYDLNISIVVYMFDKLPDF